MMITRNERLLIIYKGDFSGSVAGVAVRYISTAKELAALGYVVSIAGENVPSSSGLINYVSVKEKARFAVEVFKSDAIILHGGGPLILLYCAVMSLLGRRVILDAFAPHWLELYESPGASIKKRLKIAFNVFRLIWAAFFFDYVTVGTERQKDLVRGFLVPFGGIARMNDVHIVTGGCDSVGGAVDDDCPATLVYKSDELVVDFGWLGGVWPWFDVDFILKSFYEAFSGDAGVARLHFFGVDSLKKASMQKCIANECGGMSNVFFHGWVPYDERINFWRGIDCAVVWAEPSLENDYASRTRNFDCISLGIPVIQNRDHFWSVIIESNVAGIVADENTLVDAFRNMVSDDRDLYRKNIIRLEEQFNWGKIAGSYREVLHLGSSSVSFLNRISGVLLAPFILGLIFLNCMKACRVQKYW